MLSIDTEFEGLSIKLLHAGGQKLSITTTDSAPGKQAYLIYDTEHHFEGLYEAIDRFEREYIPKDIEKKLRSLIS